MKLIKKTAEYSVFQRRDERYAVKDANGKMINGEDKVEILYKEELLKRPEPKAEEPAEEEATESEAETTEGESE